MRAEMNGLVATVADGKVTVKTPDTSQSPVLQVEFGESILDLQARWTPRRSLLVVDQQPHLDAAEQK